MSENHQQLVQPASRAEMDSTQNPSRIASPASTGGAGTFFEQHVAAYWLAQLLVRGFSPILRDCTILEVHLQTERLGWHTDDFLIVGQNGLGDHRKLAGQVKRTITISATDNEFKNAVQDFWRDFKNPHQFSLTTDCFALVVLRGTSTLLEHFAALLDCSRAVRDVAEFERRLATTGFISAKAVQYFDTLRTIVAEIEERVSPTELWQFLRVLFVLSLDLNSATQQTEASIKSLLAYTTSDHDALNAANVSWNALLQIAGKGMEESLSFERDDLPEELRRRHSPVGGNEERALRALSDHTTPILAGIQSTIGNNLHLERIRIVQQVLEQIDAYQIVLLSGPAGSGKSGIGKDAITILGSNYFVFSFRAEEFANSHLDATLQSAQIPANTAMLQAILAGQDRKVLLVESVERLLEASTRDAFTDLLTLVANDQSWKLILTCRDYSTDLVRTAFLRPAKLAHSVVSVPPLEDSELDEVSIAYPSLARPLANTALRRLLRTPYVLDKALQIPWSDELPLPQSEREFRALFWQLVVRADHYAIRGLPRGREGVFVQVALRRARELSLYARGDNLDAEVIDALRRDSLIILAPNNELLVAPAHDVLEDWAILHWIEQEYTSHDNSVQYLSTAIGTHPALRRTYRKWVSELVERDPLTADQLFQSVVHEGNLTAQFRDDSLVSLLRSPSSAAFLERHSTELLANDKHLLLRIIHLLRVACVTTPDWLRTTGTNPLWFIVPDGPAWACVFRLVQMHLGLFTDEDRPLLLGFIEDWARGASIYSPYPEGAESVAAIAYWLLSGFIGYRSDDQRKRILRVIAKIPNADPPQFTALLRGQDADRRDRTTADFRKIILEDIEGTPAARDLPEILVEVARDYLLCSEEDLEHELRHGSRFEIETLFGIKPNRSHGYLPASAYRGPYIQLLRYHPSSGIDFLNEVFNHSAEWYAHPRVRDEYVEPPFAITLRFADGTARTQWANSRLWNLYRGTTVGPYVLQCLLMALERWLLEMAEASPRQLDTVLLSILQQSDSAAVTAVVASVATAYPHESGETLLVLLESPICIRLDRYRLASESHLTSSMFGFMGRINGTDQIYENERKEADALPHRQRDLENAIANLQLGPLAGRVHAILDRLRAEMPPAEAQNDNGRVWRLAIHRMDLRQYTVAEEADDAAAMPESRSLPNDNRQYIRLNLNEPEPDVKEMVDQNAAHFQSVTAKLNLRGCLKSPSMT